VALTPSLPAVPRMRTHVLGIAAYVGWVALSVALALVAVELVSRWWLPAPGVIGRHTAQPYLMYGNAYGLGLAYGPPGQARLVLDREGPGTYGYARAGGIYAYTFGDRVSSIAERGAFLFQDRVALADDTATKIVRVFILGGSAAYGYGASSADTRWYAVLERALSASLGREVRAVPSAMGGYVSTQERLVLELMVLPRRPDAVIVLNGYNDAALPAELGSRPGDPYNQGVTYENAYSPFFGAKRWLMQRSHLYRYLKHTALQEALEANRRRVLADPGRRQNYEESVAAVYLDNVSHMLERCEQHRIPCQVFVQPAQAVTRHHHGAESRGAGEMLTVGAYGEILRRLRTGSADPRIHDLTGLFDSPEASRWFADGVHFTDPGHRAVADAMFPRVLAALQARLPAPTASAAAPR
jgi:lysophospholipase L1-like esterase